MRRRFYFIWLIVHLWLQLGSSEIRKCCPGGLTLVLDPNGNFTCESKPELERELISVNEVLTGLPNCSSKLVQIRLPEDQIPIDSCLEMFHDELQDFPVVVYCEAERRTVKPPGILEIHKCCPQGHVYELGSCTRSTEPKVFTLQGDLEFVDVHYEARPVCPENSALVDHKLEDVYADDAGVLVSLDGKNVSLSPESSCIEFTGGPGVLAVRQCSLQCESKACIRKCCGEYEFGIKCHGRDTSTLDEFRNSLAELGESGFSDLPQNYGLLFGKPCRRFFSPYADEPWNISSTGELLMSDYEPFDHHQYCMELKNVSKSNEFLLTPFVCFDDNDSSAEVYEESSRYKHLIVGVLSTISAVFLLATLVVYASLPSLQNLHGKTLMCHSASLFFAYVCLGFSGIVTISNLTDDTCKYLAYTMIFSFDSAFFWLNVMCFDIWWTFGGMRGTVTPAAKRRTERNRFLSYCLYAWGVALLLTSGSAVFDYLGHESGLPPQSRYIGVERCWYSSKSIAEVIFFFIPISVTLIINTGLFISTSHRCGKVKAEIKQMMAKDVKDPNTRKFHSDKTRLILNVKLFVVMGIPWLLENISLYLQHYHKTTFREFLYVSDVVNSLQGLWIFILFALKPKVYLALRKRYSSGKPTSSVVTAN